MEFRAPSPLLLPSAEYIILKHRNSAKLPWHHNSKLCFWSLSFSLLTKDSFVQGITPVRCLPNSQIGSDPPQGQGWAGIPVPDHSREYRPPIPTYNWPNLEIMQVAFYLAGEITQVKDAIPWVRCASGNVFIDSFFYINCDILPLVFNTSDVSRNYVLHSCIPYIHILS